MEALGQWKQALQRGVLPDTENMEWPPEPLASTLSNVSVLDRFACEVRNSEYSIQKTRQ